MLNDAGRDAEPDQHAAAEIAASTGESAVAIRIEAEPRR